MITISEDRLSSAITGFLAGPDNVGPYSPRAFILRAFGSLVAEPDPNPWRQQMGVVAGILKTAGLVEAGTRGAGITALQAVFEDPDDWCPTRPYGPFPPRPIT